MFAYQGNKRIRFIKEAMILVRKPPGNQPLKKQGPHPKA